MKQQRQVVSVCFITEGLPWKITVNNWSMQNKQREQRSRCIKKNGNGVPVRSRSTTEPCVYSISITSIITSIIQVYRSLRMKRWLIFGVLLITEKPRIAKPLQYLNVD